MSFLGPKLLQDITTELSPDRAGPLGKEMSVLLEKTFSYIGVSLVGKERQVRGCEEKTSSKQFETDRKSFLEQYRQRQKLNNMNHETTQRTLKLAQELEEKGRQSASALQRCECRAKELIQDARASQRRWSAPPWTGSKTPIDVDARASAARHKAETLARRGLKLTLRRWDPPWV
ncbi:unnamed protein product [Timema podura]|uniref:Uncharacterized protein n=1 Tax=Timema podura TaxID=61482 RepID=A0ABN7PPJ2_TIMPD|nr:unnamed protein product [Timema podura]